MMNNPKDIARITQWILKERWLEQFRLVADVEATIEARKTRPERRGEGWREWDRGPHATTQHSPRFLKVSLWLIKNKEIRQAGVGGFHRKVSSFVHTIVDRFLHGPSQALYKVNEIKSNNINNYINNININLTKQKITYEQPDNACPKIFYEQKEITRCW